MIKPWHFVVEKCFYFLFFISIAFCFSHSCIALDIPEKPEGYVSDYAMLLTSVAAIQLNKDLNQFEQETSNQIAVVTFDSLEGESLEDFSIMLAEKWKIGAKGKDNGAILLIFEKERKIRIEVGYGLESSLTDAFTKNVINQIIVPSFAKREFDQGIFRAVGAIVDATKGEYKPTINLVSDQQKNSLNLTLLFLIVFMFIAMPLLAYLVVVVFSINFFGLIVGLFMSVFLILLFSFIRGLFFKTVYGVPIGGKKGFFTGGYYGGGVGGGFGGGSFTGGGGSFGGGGASGSW